MEIDRIIIPKFKMEEQEKMSSFLEDLKRAVRKDIDDSIIKVKVGSFTCPAATGNYSVTGVGFQARSIDFLISRINPNNVEIGVGFVDYNLNQGAVSSCDTEANDSGSYASITQGVLLSNPAAAVTVAGTVTSINSDGCVINFTAVNAVFTIIWKAVG